MSIQKIILNNQNKVVVTKVSHDKTNLSFFNPDANKQGIQHGKTFNTRLVGNTIQVGNHLLTENMETSTIQTIIFVGENTLAVKTNNSVYSVEIID
jgi:hypothetical protein